MRTSATDPAVPSPAVPARGRLRGAWAGGFWWAVRIVTTLHAVAAIGQPTFAGAYLGGNYDMLGLHARGADVVTSLSYLLLIIAIVLWILGGPRWPAVATLLLVAAETAQYFAGMAGAMELHIPLGVGVVTCSLFLAIAMWRGNSLSDQDSRSLRDQDSRSLSLSKGRPDDLDADR